MPDLDGLHGLPLTHLEWQCCGDLSDVWLAELGSLGLPLDKLVLDRCALNGEGLGMIQSLTSLSVSECYGFSPSWLAAVAGLPMLREFELTRCERVTPEGLQVLRGAPLLESFLLQYYNCVRMFHRMT